MDPLTLSPIIFAAALAATALFSLATVLTDRRTAKVHLRHRGADSQSAEEPRSDRSQH